MPSKVEPFFRFLVAHAMGALACSLSVSSLLALSGLVRFLPLLMLFAGLFLAWRYRHVTPSTRDGIITTLCAPILVVVSYCNCLRSAYAYGLTLPESGTSIYLVLLVCSLSVMYSTRKSSSYWNALGWTLTIMTVVCPVAYFFMSSARL